MLLWSLIPSQIFAVLCPQLNNLQLLRIFQDFILLVSWGSPIQQPGSLSRLKGQFIDSEDSGSFSLRRRFKVRRKRLACPLPHPGSHNSLAFLPQHLLCTWYFQNAAQSLKHQGDLCKWCNKQGAGPGVSHLRNKALSSASHNPFCLFQKLTSTFPFALQREQRERQELADAQQARMMLIRQMPTGSSHVLVFINHSLESPRNLKANLWNLKPWVSSWALQYHLFCTHRVVRSGTFRSHGQ